MPSETIHGDSGLLGKTNIEGSDYSHENQSKEDLAPGTNKEAVRRCAFLEQKKLKKTNFLDT